MFGRNESKKCIGLDASILERAEGSKRIFSVVRKPVVFPTKHAGKQRPVCPHTCHCPDFDERLVSVVAAVRGGNVEFPGSYGCLPRLSVHPTKSLRGRLRAHIESSLLLRLEAAAEPRRVCRRLQLLSRMEHHEQDNEQVFP